MSKVSPVNGVSFSGSDAPSVAWPASITAQIAAVLADVHGVDIVHRDIKAASIIVTDAGWSLPPLRVAHQSSAVPSVSEIRPSVPSMVDDLVAAMLSKDPAGRPSAEAVSKPHASG